MDGSRALKASAHVRPGFGASGDGEAPVVGPPLVPGDVRDALGVRHPAGGGDTTLPRRNGWVRDVPAGNRAGAA